MFFGLIMPTVASSQKKSASKRVRAEAPALFIAVRTVSAGEEDVHFPKPLRWATALTASQSTGCDSL